MDASLIALCGMNCALCMAYQRDKKNCGGCRSDDIPLVYCRQCSIKKCETRLQNGWKDCSPCAKPCKRLKLLDKRYRTKYGMSMLENLASIKENGMESFVGQQVRRWTCPNCGGVICVHTSRCSLCGS